jgi:hypothetical protein
MKEIGKMNEMKLHGAWYKLGSTLNISYVENKIQKDNVHQNIIL